MSESSKILSTPIKLSSSNTSLIATVVQAAISHDCDIDCRLQRTSRQQHAHLNTNQLECLLGTFALPFSWFEHNDIDLVGPLPVSQGFRYCLTCVVFVKANSSKGLHPLYSGPYPVG
ncbi:hypothetical protein J6590_056153 [Homalodisca vitripennis]|nr:hypothetical protein J6590_056153 [Homalodisca vitripennis]